MAVSRFTCCVGALLLAALAGCSQGPARRPIAGRVSFQGKPLEIGQIQFLTVAASPLPASGGMIQQGRYDIPQAQGIEPGTYRVLISSPVALAPPPGGWAGSTPTQERIPEKYSSFDKGDVTIEVTARGPTQFDFTID